VNTSTGAIDHSPAPGHHHHHGHHHHPHFDPHRGGRRRHHHEASSDGEGPGHRGPGGPWGSWGHLRRGGGWGSHRGRGGRCGHRARPHPEFIHPAMDIVSSDDAYTVTVELPGLKKDDVEISVRERVLTVSGEFKPDTSAPAPPAPSPSPDPEKYTLEDTEEEEDPFIDVEDNGERRKKKKDGAIWRERRVGKFKRSIDLPSWVDAEKGIKATMADGVLTIVFTKGPESKAKKVNIL
jgi:HSP20 family protein